MSHIKDKKSVDAHITKFNKAKYLSSDIYIKFVVMLFLCAKLSYVEAAEGSSNMIVAIGSTNEAKVLAVKEIIESSPPFSGAQVKTIPTNSDVSDQPLSLQETVQGAKNRAKNAFNKCDECNYSFGIESGLMETSDVSTGFLHVSVCSIYDGENYYTGLSTGFELPPQILELILTKKMDLSQACLYSGISNNEKIGSTEGLIGVLTKGKIDRKEYSKQCITTAILQLENAEWYVRKQIEVAR